jgi:hypothetical protein
MLRICPPPHFFDLSLNRSSSKTSGNFEIANAATSAAGSGPFSPLETELSGSTPYIELLHLSTFKNVSVMEQRALKL